LQRAAVKRMLDGWEAASPGRRATIFKALTQVRPGALLDPALVDFAAL
jgi:tRNA 2-thiocytidine biosynthesis protein TtcA